MATTKDFIVKNGVLVLGVGSVASTNTTTGALVVQGGAGIGGALNIGGKAFVLDNTDATNQSSGALQVTGGAGFGGSIYAANIYANGAAVITTATLSAQGGIVNTLTAGTDTAISTSTGNVTLWDTSTLQSVSNRGATTNNAISITNSTVSTGSLTGALVVTGGVGIGGDLWVGGTLHASVSGSSGQADNLNGGAQYDIPFQTALSTTGFDTGVFQYNDTDKTLTVDNIGIWGTSGGPGIADLQIVAATGLGIELNSVGTNAYAQLNYAGEQFIFVNAFGAELQTVNGDYSLQLDTSGNLTLGGSVGGGTFTAPNINPQNLTNMYIPFYNGTQLADSNLTYNTFNQLGGYQAVFSSSVDAHGFINKNLTQNRLIFTADSQGTQGDAANLTFDGSKLTVPSVDATGTVHISNTSSSNTSTAGALVVDGGVGIGGSLNLAGDLNVWGGAVFGQPVTFNGGATYVLSTNTVYTDNILELHVPPGGTGATWGPEGASQDIGLRFHYYNRTSASDENAAFVLAADSQTFEFYNTGAESNTGTFVGANYGDIKVGAATLVSTTNATNTQSGALIVTGGAGIGNDLYVGGLAYVNGSQVVTFDTLGSASVVNSITAGTGIIVSASTGNITVSNSGVIELTGSTYLGVSQSTGSVTLTNLGVQTLTAGTDTVVSSSTGTVTIWDKSTFQSVTNRGATTNNAVSITNSTASSDTTSGALIVTGGVGVGGSLYATTVYSNSKQAVTDVVPVAGTAITINSVSTASGTVTFTVNNNGVTSLTAGTDTAISSTTGGITFWDTSTLDSVLGRGNSSSGTISITNTSASTSTIAGNAITVTGGVGADTFYAATNMYVNGSPVVTEADIAGLGVTSITGGAGIGINTSTGAITVTNFGVRTLTAGTGTVVSSTTGTVTVWSSDTLQNVTDRGNSTSNAVNITNSTESTDTSSGALQVTGGAAVGKNLNVGGTANIGPAGQILSYTSASTGTSATLSLDSFNIADYQTAKYLVQIVDTGFTPARIQVEELMVFHDDNGASTNAYIVRYGLGYNSQELGDFDATYSAGKVTLQFIPGYIPSALTVKTLRTAITTTV